MFHHHHSLGGPKLRTGEDRVYSPRGRQSNAKVQQQQQRIPTGGALCETNAMQADHDSGSNPKGQAQKEDRYSLRKLARNLLFSNEPDQHDSFNGNYGEYELINDIPYANNNEFDNHYNINNQRWKGQQRVVEEYQDEYDNGDGKYNYKRKNNSIKPEDIQYDRNYLSTGYIQQPISREREYSNLTSSSNAKLRNNGNGTVLQKNDGMINSNIYNKTIDSVQTQFKIVAITSIPKRMSISTLITQLYGGPIEKIDLVKRDNYQFYNDESLYEMNHHIDWQQVSIFLHFNKNEDAMDFYQYSKTGLFRVNDVHLKTIWIPDVNEYDKYEIGDYDNNKGRGDDDDLEEELEERERDLLISNLMKNEERARRILVFKKPIYDKKSKLEKRKPGYPDPTINYSADFDIEEIKRDFGHYGKLVEILPVVSRKLCFGIHYYDVRSAIKIKNIIQQGVDIVDNNEMSAKDNEMRRKYSGWYVWYGKDPADRGIPT